jgi:signal transduction histidine kinase
MMVLPLGEIASFFDQIPGLVLYHLTVIIVAAATLAVLLFQRSKPGRVRAILLCIFVFTLQLAGFVPYLLSLFSFGAGNTIAGLVDRALLFTTVLCIGWFTLFHHRSGFMGWLAAIAGFLTLGVGVIATWYLTPTKSPLWFNSQAVSLVWDGITGLWVCLILLGLSASLLRRNAPPAWGLAFFGMLLVLAGTVIQISQFPQQTQFPGVARFFDLWAFPLLLMRLVAAGAWSGSQKTEQFSGADGSSGILSHRPEAETASILAKVRQSAADCSPFLADLFLSEEDEGFVRSLSGWLCRAAQAEIAFLLASSDEGQTLVFLSGYDGVGSHSIPGFVLPANPNGKLTQAVAAHRTTRINQAGAEAELLAVAHEAGLPHTGPGLYTPLGDRDENLGGVLLLSPFSGSDWRTRDEPLVASFSKAVTGAMRFIIARAHLRHSLEEARSSAEKISGEKEAFRTAKNEWEDKAHQAEQTLAELQKIRAEQAQTAPGQSNGSSQQDDLSSQIHQLEDKLAESASRDRERNNDIEKLRADSSRLKDALAAIAAHQAETNRLKEELETVRQDLRKNQSAANQSADGELVRLQQSLAVSEANRADETNRLQMDLDRKIEELTRLQTALLQPPREDRSVDGLSHSDLATMSSLISELRQPMSSAVGYTDLLLSESAGILGALQRKFLERTRAGINRMEALLDDLLQIALLADTTAAPRLSPVDITGVIDAALTASSESIRERNLIVRMDISDAIPPAEIDHDALQQIINHLIQNAVLATPPEREISITVNLPGSIRETHGALLLTVQDGGSGIASEDQQRVFTRLYRAEGPLIEGLGDSGVGMSVARTLTEALGGRIWLESQENRGTTFFVLLPWQPALFPPPPAL